MAIAAIDRSGRQNSDTERGRFLYGVTWRPWRLFAVVAKYLGYGYGGEWESEIGDLATWATGFLGRVPA